MDTQWLFCCVICVGLMCKKPGQTPSCTFPNRLWRFLLSVGGLAWVRCVCIPGTQEPHWDNSCPGAAWLGAANWCWVLPGISRNPCWEWHSRVMIPKSHLWLSPAKLLSSVYCAEAALAQKQMDVDAQWFLQRGRGLYLDLRSISVCC